MSDLALNMLAWTIWFGLAGCAYTVCRWYYVRRRKDVSFYQFTLGQVLVLMTLAAMLIFLYGTWYMDRFGPPRKH